MSKEILLQGVRVLLLPQKVIFLPAYNTLVVADWHLGKATHFRKEGIYMPAPGAHKEHDKLKALINKHSPQTVVFLGDLFHSRINSEWQAFAAFIKDYPHIRFILTIGNHDILPAAAFEDAGLTVVPQLIIDEKIICTHIPMDDVPDDMLNISGHIHPGISISSLGRQEYRLPCFYYCNNVLLLPAFGDLTGLASMQRARGAGIYAILNDEVMELPV